MNRVNGLGPGQSNEWFTPKSVFAALGCVFDLDVAAPQEGPLHVPCRAWISEGSLEKLWHGFVWMNPPFGGRGTMELWLNKFFAHGNGIALSPDRTSSPWFREAWSRADAVMFAGRTPFLPRCGKPAGNPAFGTTLWAAGQLGRSVLRRAHERGYGMLVLDPVQAGRSSQADLFEVAA